MQLTELSVNSFIEDDVASLGPISGVRHPSPKDFIIKEAGEEAYCFITDQVNLEDDVFLTATNSPFTPGLFNSIKYKHIVNLKNLNDTPQINHFFCSANVKLPLGGLYINCIETFDIRKKRILKLLPMPLNRIYYLIDMLLTRVFPKLRITKKIYHSITKGKGRVLSRTEILGRLYYCGFEVLTETYINKRLYFVARKIKEASLGKAPYYGLVIRLKRVGKDGKMFNVYKLRTMHAYSEYLQQYVFEKNQLQEGGKFKDDFRISPEGKVLRKFWLDELPMFINFLRRDMKLVGVRPLSQHYFNLYTRELQQKRVQCKPGLIPPFYADMPKTLEEIMASEMRYLEAYIKSPLKTDISYFFKAFRNILFKGARSK